MCTTISKDDSDDRPTDTSMVVDVRTSSDVKYYFISLAVTILTMCIWKTCWFIIKNVSFKFGRSFDEINAWILQNREKARLQSQDIAVRDNDSNNIKTIMTESSRKNLKIRNSVSSSTSLRSVSLSDDTNRGIARSDSEYSNIEKGGTNSRSPSPPIVNDKKIVGIIIMNNK